MVQDVKNWRTDDPFPNHELHEIPQISARIKSLISRRRAAPILATNFLNVAGVADMVDGLEYHFSRIQEAIEEYAETAHFEKPRGMSHDAVAYLNRVGQIHAFMKSSVMRPTGFKIEIDAPTFSKLIIFRNKFSAHRSLDDPRRETEHERTVTALSFHGGTSTWKPRNGIVESKQPVDGLSGDEFKRWWADKFRSSIWQIQIQDQGNFYEFCPEEDHPSVCAETYNAVARLLA